MLLRRYALCPVLTYAATLLTCRKLLRHCCAVSGTDRASASTPDTHCLVLTYPVRTVWYCHGVCCARSTCVFAVHCSALDVQRSRGPINCNLPQTVLKTCCIRIDSARPRYYQAGGSCTGGAGSRARGGARSAFPARATPAILLRRAYAMSSTDVRHSLRCRSYWHTP